MDTFSLAIIDSVRRSTIVAPHALISDVFFRDAIFLARHLRDRLPSTGTRPFLPPPSPLPLLDSPFPPLDSTLHQQSILSLPLLRIHRLIDWSIIRSFNSIIVRSFTIISSISILVFSVRVDFLFLFYNLCTFSLSLL